MLSEKSQIQKATYYILIQHFGKNKTVGTVNRLCLP